LSRFSWPKENRIRKTRNYQKIQTKGKRRTTGSFIVLYIKSKNMRSRIGITVSKKVGNAVQRNRVKRMLREGIRKEYPNLKNAWDIVFIAKSSSVNVSSENTKKQVRNIFYFLSRKPR
jgi:ribonuclease P protein component